MSKEAPEGPELPDPDLKIILLGDSAVGKSKLIERYLMDEYNPRQVFNALYFFSQNTNGVGESKPSIDSIASVFTTNASFSTHRQLADRPGPVALNIRLDVIQKRGSAQRG
jgi:GTPase SAR1 family protein